MIEIRQTLNDLKKRDLTLLISTHILKEVSEMCTSMTMISGDVNTLIHNAAMDARGVDIELKTLTEFDNTFVYDIEHMQGVSSLERTGEKSVKFRFIGTDEQQADIVDMVYRHKLRLLSMNESGADIESLYMQLTDDGEVNVK